MSKRRILAIGLNTPSNEKKIIKEKLSLDDVILHTASIKDLIFKIVNNKLDVTCDNKTINRYDYVWIQTGWSTTHVAFLLDKYLRYQNIPHNKSFVQQSKLSDIFILALKGLTIPNTYFQCGNKKSTSKTNNIVEVCNLPCIYKTFQGSLGTDVYLINSRNELHNTILKGKDSFKFMFQKYIPNDFDYRVLIANNEPYSICRRIRGQNEYRNNTALGATEEFITVSQTPLHVIKMAIQATKALKLKWAGVDVVTDKNTGISYILEVNRRPGLTKNSTETIAAYRFVAELAGL